MKLLDLSIKRKMMLITMLTSSAALVLFSASFLVYDLLSFRHFLSSDLGTQAQIISYNSAAAMAFKDEAAATVTLSALKAKDDVVAAVLYTADGRAFAHYYRSHETPALPKNIEAKGSRFTGTNIEVVNDVTLGGE